jgi:hypothetical protein
MKLYTVAVHSLQMCMKEYVCCPKFRRGDNSTYTFVKRGACTFPISGLVGVVLTRYTTPFL